MSKPTVQSQDIRIKAALKHLLGECDKEFLDRIISEVFKRLSEECEILGIVPSKSSAEVFLRDVISKELCLVLPEFVWQYVLKELDTWHYSLITKPKKLASSRNPKDQGSA